MEVVQALRRITLGLVAALAGLTYVWFAAVRAVPEVRRRKTAARAERRRRH
jgi:hypothetical protein